jgi:hypothetical protein
MDKLDEIAKALKDGKRDSEKRVANRHTDGNQITYGGQARYDCGTLEDATKGLIRSVVRNINNFINDFDIHSAACPHKVIRHHCEFEKNVVGVCAWTCCPLDKKE